MLVYTVGYRWGTLGLRKSNLFQWSKAALCLCSRKTVLHTRIIAVQISFKRYSRIKNHFLLVRPAGMGEINLNWLPAESLSPAEMHKTSPNYFYIDPVLSREYHPLTIFLFFVFPWIFWDCRYVICPTASLCSLDTTGTQARGFWYLQISRGVLLNGFVVNVVLLVWCLVLI